MDSIVFTKEQVTQILNTLLEMPAKHSYDALRMIEQVTTEQAKKENESKEN